MIMNQYLLIATDGTAINNYHYYHFTFSRENLYCFGWPSMWEWRCLSSSLRASFLA